MGLSSNFWKLDKIDKIGISIILVFFAILSVFQCFSYAETRLYFSVQRNTTITQSFEIQEATYANMLYYYPVKQGQIYTFHNEGDVNQLYVLGVASSIELGSKVTYISYNSNLKDEYTFDIPHDGYIVLTVSPGVTESTNYYLTTQETDFSSIVLKLTEDVGINKFWNIFETSIPYIYFVVIVAIGFYFIFHAIHEMSKGRDN